MADGTMLFEKTMRLFFGERAYQIAGTEATPGERTKWMRKCVRLLMKKADEFDTTLQHKGLLMAELESLEDQIRKCKDPSWELVYRLLRVVGRLCGCHSHRGAYCHTPTWHQTIEQHYTSVILAGGDVMQNCYDRKDIISVRQELVQQLKTKGYDDFKVALALNTTEYQVKRLKSPVTKRRDSGHRR